jgi:hypothetical protein
LESEGAFANVVTGHKRVINNDPWLHEEVVLSQKKKMRIKIWGTYFTICVLVEVLFVTLFTRHLAANRILANIKLSVIPKELH